MTTVHDLEQLGYTVGVAHSADDEDTPTVYRVEHDDLGISLQVNENDCDTIDSLADPDLHAQRLEVKARRDDGNLNVALHLDDGTTSIVETPPPPDLTE